jgi:hypothetical protein
MTTIEGQALQCEDNGSLAWSGLQTEFVERPPEKHASAELSTQHGIEAVRFGVFAPPGSPLDRQTVMILPLTMNNAARWLAWVFPCFALTRDQPPELKKTEP